MIRPRIFAALPIDEASREMLHSIFDVMESRNHTDLDATASEMLACCDAIICPLTLTVSSDLLYKNPRLKLIANVAVGYDNIDIQASTKHEVLVTNTPGVLTDTTADLAFGLMLSCARRIAEADQFVRGGHWTDWSLELMVGVDVSHKTLGIIGCGRIGQAVARRARGFNMSVLYAQPRALPSQLERELGLRRTSLDELMAESDFVSLHLPLNKDTYHSIGRRELALAKPNLILINTARGSVVDQSALIDALASGRILAAGLDVFEDEPRVPEALIEMSRVVLSPHIGSASKDTRAAMSLMAAQSAVYAFQGRKPPHMVNPSVWESFCTRLKSNQSAYQDRA